MTKEELDKVEKQLTEHGYRKISGCKYKNSDDYEYYKSFRDKEDLKYQIFFEVWNFEKYQHGAGYSVSVSVMPESVRDNVGRRDLQLFVDWSTDIERVEKAAEMFYDFVKQIDKL